MISIFQVLQFLALQWFKYFRSCGSLLHNDFNISGLAVPGLTMILIQFAGCNQTAAVAMLVLCLTAGGFTMGGFQVNHIDLSPNFAGKFA
jgi:hypothetical protein